MRAKIILPNGAEIDMGELEEEDEYEVCYTCGDLIEEGGDGDNCDDCIATQEDGDAA